LYRYATIKRKKEEEWAILNEITAITPQVKDKTRCNIYIDGRFCCGLTLETVVKNRLKVGKIVTEQALAEMQLESEKNTALNKALGFLSATRKTEREVRSYLTKKGYLPEVGDYVVEKLREYGFINDEEYAEAYTESAAKRKGNRRIRMELKGKGLSDEAIEGALTGLDPEQELETAKAILEKYMRGKNPDKEGLQKAYRYLLGKGFDYETAKAAIAAYGEIDDEE
jgi:regulatory protein